MPVDVLIQGMIVQSGNDATIALAEAIAGTEDTFAALMNQYAERLGMAQSHFENCDRPARRPTTRCPPPTWRSSTRAIIAEFPEYYRWYSQREFTWNNIRQPNRNGLLARDPSVDGVKTGMTEAAGYCLVSSAKRDGMRLIAVVDRHEEHEGARGREPRAAELRLQFLRDAHAARRPANELRRAARLQGARRARGGRARAATSWSRCRAASRERVEYQVELAPKVFAPLSGPTASASLRALVDGKVIAEAPLHPLADVPRGNIFRRIWDTILSWFA